MYKMIHLILSILFVSNLFAEQMEALIFDQPTVITVTNEQDDAFYQLYNKQYKIALSKFDDLLKDNPFHLSALTGKAKCLFELGEINEAYNTYTIAYNLDSNNDAITEALGNCAFYLKDFNAAHDFFQKALLEAPENPTLHETLSKVYMCQGRYNEAIKQAKVAKLYYDNSELRAPSLLILSYFAMAEINDLENQKTILKFIKSSKKESNWPYPILKFINKDLSDTQLLSQVETLQQEIQAHTYIGLMKRSNKENLLGQAHFEWASSREHPVSYESLLSEFLLKTPRI